MNREYKEWTDHELALLRNAEGELTATQLADQLPGRNRADVHMYCDANDIPFRRQWRRRTWNDKERQLLIALAGTVPVDEIARQVDRTPSSVRSLASKIGISLQYTPPIESTTETPPPPPPGYIRAADFITTHRAGQTITRKQVENETGTSSQIAIRALQYLAKQGLAHKQGVTNHCTWVIDSQGKR